MTEVMEDKKQMNYPAANCGVAKTARNEANLVEYDPERFKILPSYRLP